MARNPDPNVFPQYEAVATRYDALAHRVTHWLLTNPGKPLTHLAREIGVSPNYIYVFVSTDAFKNKYRELVDAEFKDVMVNDLAAKIRGAANLAIDRVTEQLALSQSSEYVLDASEMLINAAVKMDAPKNAGPQVQINNFPAIPADVLARTQQGLLSGNAVSPLPGGSVTVQHVKELPANG
jgi:hypothetical protein